jgi:hypothetical protein
MIVANAAPAARMGIFSLLVGCSLLISAAEGVAQEKALKGFSFVEKIVASGAEPVYQVDGYQVQIVAGTDKEFRDTINSLSDVQAGTWVRFSGKRDSSGIMIAEKAIFYPVSSEAKRQDTSQLQTTAPQTDSLIDAEGQFKPLHSKVRMSDAGGWCGWHKVPAEGEQQARVRRIGNRLLPAYLNQMAEDQVIPRFRFFVVEEKVIRSELACNPGLVLIPGPVLDRLKTDDQLAAVLAAGIAYNVQSLRARLIARDKWFTAAEIAELSSLAMNPIAGLATNGAVGIAVHEHNLELELERGRLALSMMADAGYDPWQAPEAWKLLTPKRLPKNLSSLKYPRLSQYQRMVLEAQYKGRTLQR